MIIYIYLLTEIIKSNFFKIIYLGLLLSLILLGMNNKPVNQIHNHKYLQYSFNISLQIDKYKDEHSLHNH